MRWKTGMEVLLLLSLACAPRPLDGQSEDSAVYMAVVAALHGAPSVQGELVVQDSTPVFLPELLFSQGEDRHPLLIELAAAANRRLPSSIPTLPNRVRYVSDEEGMRLAREGLGGFSSYSLSPVVYSVDRAQAAVYAERHCGGLCGAGAAFLLTKEGGRWQIAREYVIWIS